MLDLGLGSLNFLLAIGRACVSATRREEANKGDDS